MIVCHFEGKHKNDKVNIFVLNMIHFKSKIIKIPSNFKKSNKPFLSFH